MQTTTSTRSIGNSTTQLSNVNTSLHLKWCDNVPICRYPVQLSILNLDKSIANKAVMHEHVALLPANFKTEDTNSGCAKYQKANKKMFSECWVTLLKSLEEVHYLTPTPPLALMRPHCRCMTRGGMKC